MDDTNKDEDTMLDNAEQQIQNEIKLLQIIKIITNNY